MVQGARPASSILFQQIKKNKNEILGDALWYGWTYYDFKQKFRESRPLYSTPVLGECC